MSWFRYSDRWSDRHYRALMNCRNALVCGNGKFEGSNRRPRQRVIGSIFLKYWAYEMAEEDGLIARDGEGRFRVSQFLSDPPGAIDNLLSKARCRDAFRRMEAEAPGRERTCRDVIERLRSENVVLPFSEALVSQVLDEWTEVREVRHGTYVAIPYDENIDDEDIDDESGLAPSSMQPGKAVPLVGPAAKGEKLRSALRRVLANGPLSMKEIVAATREQGMAHANLDQAVRSQIKKMDDVVNVSWGVYGLEGALGNRAVERQAHIPSPETPKTPDKLTTDMRGGRTREGRNNTDFREVIRDHLRSGPSSLRRIAAAMVRAGYDFAHPRNAASEYLRSMPDVIKLRWGVYGLRTEAVDNADLEESPHQGIDQIAPPGEVDQPGAPPDMLSGGDAPSEVKADVEEVRDSIRRHAVSLLKMRGSMRINQLAEAIVETGIGLDAKRIEEIIRGLPGFRIARRGS